MNIASRLSKVKPSATLAMSARAKALKAEGKDIISLAAGEPDFDTPLHIKEAAHQAINAGKTKYTPVAGTLELRTVIAEYASKIYGENISYEQTMVCSGAKHALFNLCHALLEPHDEAVIISPYWVSYPDMIHLQGAKAKIVYAKQNSDFIPAIEDLEKELTEKTKLLFINSPSNPTGVVYPSTFYQGLADLLERYPNCYVVSDDIYCGLSYDHPFTCLFHIAPNLRHRILLINGVSKTYAMTGWRVGFIIAQPEFIQVLSRIQGASTSGICSIAQSAACAALNGPQEDALEMFNHFKERRDLIYHSINNLPNVSAIMPQGAFYIFPDFSHYMRGELNNSAKLSEFFLEQALVASVPGSGFGAEGFIRMSFATSLADLEKACSRIEDVLTQIPT